MDGLIWFGIIGSLVAVWVASAAVRAYRDTKREQLEACIRRHPASWQSRPDAADYALAQWKARK